MSGYEQNGHGNDYEENERRGRSGNGDESHNLNNRPPEEIRAPFDSQGGGHIYPPVIKNDNHTAGVSRYGEQNPGESQGYYGRDQEGQGRYNHSGRELSEQSGQWQTGQIDRSRFDGSGQSGYKRPEISRGDYRFNPESGWQRGGYSTPGRKYEWNFQEYNELEKIKKERGKKGRGALVFAICLVTIVIVSVAGITGYAFLNGAGNVAEDAPGASSSVPDTDDSVFALPGENAQIELQGKPSSSGEAVTPGGKLTIPQIARLVTPSVVGVSAFQGSRYYDPLSMGSGIILTENGYIVTNAHVVTGATKFKVQLNDNRSFDASIVGLDASTDLAVLKIETEGLTPAIFGNSEDIEVGEMVVAIGNPSGSELAGSVTNGIVSAINRQVTTGYYSFNYIQTNAAINPGNSGGPLVNEYGQVIGITSSKIVATGYEGIGFAIPISDAKPILDDIIAYGRVTGRVMLGISCIPVSDVDAKNFGVPPGLEIQEVFPNSDIVNYDVQSGDILTHIEGTAVHTLSDVQTILKSHKAGDRVTLRFFRRVTAVEDIEFEITVRLIEN